MTIEIHTKQLTPRANELLLTAHKIAQETGAAYIGTEHILMALVRMNWGGPGKILQDAKITEAKIKLEIFGTGD